jgi:hypothetical protein
MDLPGARAAHLHFTDRAVHDVAERMAERFIDGWLKRMHARSCRKPPNSRHAEFPRRIRIAFKIRG